VLTALLVRQRVARLFERALADDQAPLPDFVRASDPSRLTDRCSLDQL